jgi:hypothetical protein
VVPARVVSFRSFLFVFFEGLTYFFNANTSVTTWERPAELLRAGDAQAVSLICHLFTVWVQI